MDKFSLKYIVVFICYNKRQAASSHTGQKLNFNKRISLHLDIYNLCPLVFPQQTFPFVIFCPYFWIWHTERSIFPRQFRFHSQTYLLINLNNHVKSHHYLFACFKDSCQFAAKVLPGHLDQLENQEITWCHYFQDCNSIKASDQFVKWTPL